MKRVVCILLAAAMSLSLSPTVSAVKPAASSGCKSISKLSPTEITELLHEKDGSVPSKLYSEVPDLSAFKAGILSQETQQTLLDRLNAIRRLAGLPAAKLNESASDLAQHAASLMAITGEVTHRPAQPSNVPDSFFLKAKAGARSNMSGGRQLSEAIDVLTNDSGLNNLTTVGHRRWQLSAELGTVGFGYAESNTWYRRYTAVNSRDQSNPVSDYDFIAWPASGYFPADHNFFTTKTPWTVSLNYYRYMTPDISKVKVTLIRGNDGKKWTFSGGNYQVTETGAYFNIDTHNYGDAGAIIFRPDGISEYEGTYTVRIDGLQKRTANGKSGEAKVSIEYQVTFFNTTECEKEITARLGQAFKDVPPTAWYYPYVQRMCEPG